jgi:phosphoribosylformylglycinamidine synthase
MRTLPDTALDTIARMRFAVRVETRLRAGIADPQGSTIERSLPTLGFAGVHDVRVGKCFRFELDAADEAAAAAEVDDMCRRFLTNPVIEDFAVELTAVAPTPAGAS